MSFLGFLWMIITIIFIFAFRGGRRVPRERDFAHVGSDDMRSENRNGGDIPWPQVEHIVDTVFDPVCGAYVSEEKAVVKNLNGTERYFCCEACAEKFSGKFRQAI